MSTTSALARAEATTERYRHAMEAGDPDLALTTFAPDAVLHSPLTSALRFTGIDEIRRVVECAFGSFANVRFHTDVGDERTRTVISSAQIGGVDIEETAVLRLNADADITEATLFVRPLPGLVALMGEIGPELARRAGRPWAARLLRVLVAPLRLMVRSGDGLGVRLTQPR
ncbi:SnoaL-like domain-containing protein [Amycolatopsis marina]|uniref:SnoaL-like domain-containing protein n=1 Tax=Amycolatopsis marina TaxID=490629 RepID=A0A1I0XNN8_9PSEU|nr:nuclear transport factor 2 family protein [Amycolatopsis marina]SFB02582.1 SnoaL-like domain-containing protein [Amycolatopsis marina]